MHIYLFVFGLLWGVYTGIEHIAISDPLFFIPILSNAAVALIALVEK